MRWDEVVTTDFYKEDSHLMKGATSTTKPTKIKLNRSAWSEGLHINFHYAALHATKPSPFSEYVGLSSSCDYPVLLSYPAHQNTSFLTFISIRLHCCYWEGTWTQKNLHAPLFGSCLPEKQKTKKKIYFVEITMTVAQISGQKTLFVTVTTVLHLI